MHSQRSDIRGVETTLFSPRPWHPVGTGFPTREGDRASEELVNDKLKLTYVRVGPSLFDILHASEDIEKDASAAWDKKRTTTLEHAEPKEIRDPWFSVFRLVCSAFRGVFQFSISSFKMVSCLELKDVIGMLSGDAMDAF